MTNQEIHLAQSDSHSARQITHRFTSLKNSLNEEVEKWNTATADHQTYVEDYDQCLECIQNLSDQLQRADAMSSDDKSTMEEYKLAVQELQINKDNNSANIHKVLEEGENLFSHTSSSGREILRHNKQ